MSLMGRGVGSIGYARVSTLEQNADLQHVAFRAAGCDRIFTDPGVSGTRINRLELDELLDHLRDGNEVVVWKLERLERSPRNLLALIDDLENRGVHFRSVTEGISTTGSMGTANHTTVKRARDLKAEGISRADIGNIIGVSRASVYRYLGISTDERPA